MCWGVGRIYGYVRLLGEVGGVLGRRGVPAYVGEDIAEIGEDDWGFGGVLGMYWGH